MGTLQVAEIFTDSMVLQRDARIPLWGRAEHDAEITVSFCGQTVRTKARGGEWSLYLEPVGAGGPYEMRISSGREEILLKDILVGDVYLAGGQSNMEYVLANDQNGAREIEEATYPNIRFYNVPRIPYEGAELEEPKQYSKDAAWQCCSPKTAGSCSAVAYYFAKDIYSSVGVPVGIINCSWGGTSASCWMSRESLEDPAVRVYLDEYEAYISRQSSEQYEKERSQYAEALREYARKVSAVPYNPEKKEEYMKAVNSIPYPWPPPLGPKSFLRPAGLYYTMLRKIAPFSVKAVIWYQGESDTNKPALYRTLFGRMIDNWRGDFKNPQLPFLFVQLPSYGGGNPDGEDWAYLREQQVLVSKQVPHTAMAVCIDCGEKDNIHPINKEPVGKRLALLARRRIYGQDVEDSGPVLREMKIEGNKAVLTFDHASGLVLKGDGSKGFQICGEVQRFVDAKAEIQGDAVVVYAEGVENPKAVRYGWSNHVETFLYNGAGLPASPFRTDGT